MKRSSSIMRKWLGAYNGIYQHLSVFLIFAFEGSERATAMWY